MFLVVAASLTLAPQGLALGRAIADVTPLEPLPLGGYTERGSHTFEPGGDPLYARVLMFSGSGQSIAVVALDSLTVPESLVREVKERIPAGIALFLSATHTHSAPDSQMLNDRMTFAIPGIASYKSKWLAWYADQIARAIRNSARGGSGLSGLEVGETRLGANQPRRRLAQPDTLLTTLYARDGTPSQTVTLSTAWGLNAPLTFPRPLLVQYAAHATVFGADRMKTSGDWPGLLSRALGGPLLQGAIGDVLPRSEGTTSDTRLRNMVRSILLAVARSTTWRAWEPGDLVGALHEPIPLDPVRPHPTMAKAYRVPEAFASSIVQQFAPNQASITALRFGKLAVVGVPGEPTSELGSQIREAGRRIGFRSVLVCSHVNGWMGYILTPPDYDRGGYEATLSFYGREQGTKVVGAAIAALRRLANEASAAKPGT